MKKVIFLSFMLVFLTACSMHHIGYNGKNNFFVSLDNKTVIKRHGDVIYKNQINLLQLYVNQKVLQMKNGKILTYEEVQTAAQYKFSFGIKRIVGIIFPEYTYDYLDQKGNIHFFILTNKITKQKVYMLLENINKKSLKLVYGFTEVIFNRLKELLIDNKSIVENDKVNNTDLKVNKSSYVLSSWNPNIIILDNIVSKMGVQRPLKR